MFARLKPFDERRGRRALGSRRCSGGSRGPLFGITGAIVVGVRAAVDSRARPVRRLRVPGARSDRQRHQRRWRSATSGHGRRRATSRRGCAGCSARSPPTIRSCRSTIDRERALALGLPLSEITSALQIYLGSQYVNDFDFNNRAYRVYVQADQAVPLEPAGAAAALRAHPRRRDGAARAGRVDCRRRPRRRSSATSTCSARRRSTDRRRPGSAPARRCRRWSGWRGRRCPQGMGYAWSGHVARRDARPGGSRS